MKGGEVFIDSQLSSHGEPKQRMKHPWVLAGGLLSGRTTSQNSSWRHRPTNKGNVLL